MVGLQRSALAETPLGQARFDSWTDLGLPVSIDFLPRAHRILSCPTLYNEEGGPQRPPSSNKHTKIQGIVVPSPGKKPKKPQKICTWIRERTSPYCFGVKAKAGNPAHCNRNDDIKYHFQCLKSGWFGRRLSRLKNKDMADHFAGTKTFYFTSDGRSKTAEVLINIDIDCHKSGTLEGAIAFAEHLKATKFPNLYFEASTNGKGVHGYVVVLKGNLGDEGLNGALSILDRWLKAELSQGDWDVETVEIKAHCPEFTWGQEKYQLRTYKSGQLAKLPREALTRADELRGTTRVAVDDLRRLKVPSWRTSRMTRLSA